MKFLAALPTACFAATTLFSGILALPAPIPEPKNVFRPRLPYWARSRGVPVAPPTPLSPPLPKFQHDVDAYDPASPSGEYLGEDVLLAEEEEEPQCVHPECKCHTKHQDVEVLVAED